MSPDLLIPLLLTLAWLAPLAGAVAAWAAGRWQVDYRSRLPAWIAVGAMAASLNLALAAGAVWWRAIAALGAIWSWNPKVGPFSGTYYGLGEFGSLSLSVDYYVDSLTVLMFAVVTLIATCVHVYAVAYVGEGHPDDDAEDHPEPTAAELSEEAALHDAQPTPFNPQFARFFSLLQLFTFAMLGLVIAGNLLQTFVFWELVGAVSYLLIGFHFERPHAAGAATKAFVMNRIGDAGFLVGIAILWTAFGTLRFADRSELVFRHLGSGEVHDVSAIVQGDDYNVSTRVDAGVITSAANAGAGPSETPDGTQAVSGAPLDRRDMPRWWLALAGVGLFAGCVGKSAQLPLSTWLPDAMAGPTPVSALVHSATMVAAGVYLVGRLYPLFLPEVLIVIAYAGAATLVYGATCALVQTDLKRILAWSTVSQLGYMMLALGVGGREEGLFHLVTHAFFKSLLFLAAGSVIIACRHVQDVARLGGLWRRMPLTAWTSFVGVIAITGLAVPLVEPFGEAIAFSGYHSKDSILAAALAFARENPKHGLLFALPLVTAGLTAFYMFRFWLLAFAGPPRDEELARHVRESSPLMTVPLLVLAIFAAFVAIGGERGPLFGTIAAGSGPGAVVGPRDTAGPTRAAEPHHTASVWGLVAATIGTAAAAALYGARLLDTRRTGTLFGPIARLFHDGWRLDQLYRTAVVWPYGLLASVASLFDRHVLDPSFAGLSRGTVALARLDRTFDERVVDGLVNRLADVTYATGRGLRHVQTGRLRQYVIALAAAAVILFALAVVLIPK